MATKPKDKNKLLQLTAGLLGFGGGYASAEEKEKVTLTDVYKTTKKFGESMEGYLDLEYSYINYLRNRGSDDGSGGTAAGRGSKTIYDLARDKRNRKPRSGDYVPYRRPPKKPLTRAQFLKNRRMRLTNAMLMNKHGLTRNQIKVYRNLRSQNISVTEALRKAKASPKGANILLRQWHKVADNIPNRPLWMTKHAKWRTNLANTAKKLNPVKKAPQFLKRLNPKNLNAGALLNKIPKPIRAGGGHFLQAGLAFLDFQHKTNVEGKTNLRAGIETGVTTACNTVGFMAAANATLPVSGPLMGAPELLTTTAGALMWLGAGIMGAMACDKTGEVIIDKAYDGGGYKDGYGPTNKNRIGSVIGGGSGGAVITSPTRGMLGGIKALVGEAQEAEVILPMSKIGDAISAVYREGASVMVGASIAFLGPLRGSSAAASLMAEARALQSIVGTSEDTSGIARMKMPEIKTIEVVASNTETNNVAQGGFAENIKARASEFIQDISGQSTPSSASWGNPLEGGVIGHTVGQRFGGPRESYPGGHKGLDLVEKKPYGSDPEIPVKAMRGGVVVAPLDLPNPAYTENVRIDHGNGVVATYMHIHSGVNPGQEIKKGQRIGKLKNLEGVVDYTGRVNTIGDTHLHLEVEKDGVLVDPLPYLKGQRNEKGAVTVSPVSGVSRMLTGTVDKIMNNLTNFDRFDSDKQHVDPSDPPQNRNVVNNTPVSQLTKNGSALSQSMQQPQIIPIPQTITRTMVEKVYVTKDRTLVISDQGKGVLVS